MKRWSHSPVLLDTSQRPSVICRCAQAHDICPHVIVESIPHVEPASIERNRLVVSSAHVDTLVYGTHGGGFRTGVGHGGTLAYADMRVGGGGLGRNQKSYVIGQVRLDFSSVRIRPAAESALLHHAKP